MLLQSLLLEGFGSGMLKRLLALLQSDISGELDGNSFQSCSINGSGRRAFVIKGWIDNKKGPMVRFRARWGELGDGEIHYQKDPQSEKEDTDTTDVDLRSENGKLALVVSFKTDDGKDHSAVFRTSTDILKKL